MITVHSKPLVLQSLQLLYMTAFICRHSSSIDRPVRAYCTRSGLRLQGAYLSTTDPGQAAAPSKLYLKQPECIFHICAGIFDSFPCCYTRVGRSTGKACKLFVASSSVSNSGAFSSMVVVFRTQHSYALLFNSRQAVWESRWGAETSTRCHARLLSAL
jgi:hypothetical protein